MSQGLFLKFFEKKKSMRKHKNMKFLMAKFLRKMLLISKIRNLIILVRNNPLHLTDFLLLLNSQIIHKYANPLNNQIVEEAIPTHPSFKILNFIFRKNLNFSKNKIKKKGRIKRKITRKVTLLNNLTD